MVAEDAGYNIAVKVEVPAMPSAAIAPLWCPTGKTGIADTPVLPGIGIGYTSRIDVPVNARRPKAPPAHFRWCATRRLLRPA